jgi:hypothetical protein
MWLMMSVAAAVLAVSAAVDTVAPPSATVIPTPAGRPWHTPTGPDRPRSRRGGRPVTAVSPSGENATCRPHDAADSAASPYAGRCGQPGGESSQSSCRPYGVRSRMLLTKTSRSTPREVVLYVRYTSSPSRRKTLSMKPPPAPQSSANDVPRDDTNGRVQPIRVL